MSKLKHKQPIFFGELLVLRGEEQFIAFDGRTGERRWSRKVSTLFVKQVGDYILAWNGSNSNGRAACLDLKTGKIRWDKAFGHGCQAFAQPNVIHFFHRNQTPLRHFVVDPQTGETIRSYKEIPLDRNGSWWGVISCGARGALLRSHGHGKKKGRKKGEQGDYCFYKLDGKKPQPWRFGDTKIEHVIASNEKYVVVKEHGNQLAVYKFEDDGYRATPLAMAGTGYDRNNMYFDLDGERLICVYRGRRVIIFDLQAKKILHDSDVKESQRLKNDKDKKKHKSGLACLLRDGNRLFVQMRPPWGAAPAAAPSYFLDLQTGKTTEAPGIMIPWDASRRILRYSNGLIHHSIRNNGPHRRGMGYSIQFWCGE